MPKQPRLAKKPAQRRGQTRAHETSRAAATAAGRKAAGKKPKLTAKTADKHLLYEASVQDPPQDVHFIDRVFRKERKRTPLVLREDFCGTGNMSAHWAKSHPERQAIGLDLHAPTMAWGRKHHITPMGEDGARVQLRRQNVLEPTRERADAVCAFNFSYCCFLSRAEMLRYARAVRKSLTRDGIFFLDIHGGTECLEEMEETTKHKGFTYVWDQGPFDAITGCTTRYIHFRFPDGTELKRAFGYAWRSWNLPELRDILLEAGFSRVDVYWEGTDADGEGNGVFRRRRSAENELSWIAYIVALA